jgi:1-acyl-sn-glycerol-3-phosphate acyltransferase
MLPFKKGAFMMAMDAGVPVVPVTVSGATKIMPKGEVKIFPSTVRITVHEPISTAGYSKETVHELMEKTRAQIFSALDQTELEINDPKPTRLSKTREA